MSTQLKAKELNKDQQHNASKKSLQAKVRSYESQVTRHLSNDEEVKQAGSIPGVQLFSLFTADIIVKDVVFTR